MEALTDQVQLAFHDLVMIGGWLSNDTKKLAESKIRAIIHNIGYPDYILDDKLLQDEFFGVSWTLQSIWASVTISSNFLIFFSFHSFLQV